MALRLYSTLSRTKEEFQPAGDEVRMYVCGVTPYDTTHLGHALCYLVFDVLNRYLRYLGWRVRYIQNITDIDDDILKRASAVGKSWDELGNEFVAIHQQSLDALGVDPPESYPRATEAIPEIIEITSDLLDRGHAYVAGGNVYFRVASDTDYGKLSLLDADTMLRLLDERGGRSDDPNKEQPLDFLLWQGARPGEPKWDSPWGPGRPGWHIECTAMAIRDLGETLDIHGGGADLIFPHHESEIAQSETWTGREPFTRFWMHVGMLRMNGEKMSKSLGNMVFVRDLLEQEGVPPEAIRLYLLGTHYRDELEYDESSLRESQRLAERWKRAARLDGVAGSEIADAAAYRRQFLAALDDDLDTPSAIRILSELSGQILSSHDRGQAVKSAQSDLRNLAAILGVSL